MKKPPFTKTSFQYTHLPPSSPHPTTTTTSPPPNPAKPSSTRLRLPLANPNRDLLSRLQHLQHLPLGLEIHLLHPAKRQLCHLFCTTISFRSRDISSSLRVRCTSTSFYLIHHSQAALSIQGPRVDAMNATRFALVVTFSIIGSSLLSILAYYLLSRCRHRGKRRREKERREIEDKIRSQYLGSRDGRSFDSRRGLSRDRERSFGYREREKEDAEAILAEFPLPLPNTSARPVPTGMVSAPVLSRENALTYDPEKPDEPPRFRSWLEET
ncbi:hypothetical protein G7Y89_g1073 [Cudoniella acicularis]|uniref:Uncharacterized protein n=1 Tax=Cudoniella acicularis TaxID=354080 RepID=A0A8H4W7C1_9HELO|nr:hypothetical protein G7Y89_g1073 [Cudoniella acicularis]